MPTIKKIEDRKETAQIYLQILSRAAAAAPNNLQVLPCHEDGEESKLVKLWLSTEKYKDLERKIPLQKTPAWADLLTDMSIIYDMLELARGNKPHYQKGSHLTFKQATFPTLQDVDAYMDEFERLAQYNNVQEFREAADLKAADENLQWVVLGALGAPHKYIEGIVEQPAAPKKK